MKRRYCFVGYTENHYAEDIENECVDVRIVGVFSNCADAIKAMPCHGKRRSTLERCSDLYYGHNLLTWQWDQPTTNQWEIYNYMVYKIVARKIK